jgi:hypothetical protein
MAANLPPSNADVTESGSLNLPEPFGPQRPVMGLLYLLQSGASQFYRAGGPSLNAYHPQERLVDVHIFTVVLTRPG